MEFKDAYSPYECSWKIEENEITIKYNKDILKDRERWSKDILKRINECIDESFQLSGVESSD